ncbi:YdcH family protein [Xanthobacter sp. AM11]|uniref:YdcH family protein n=1 Tax=Xanthobacter sp. AM11 TaxID=3380643 RepID=UPI0039BEE521
MSIQSHLLELKRRHAAIEQELSRELAHPASDPVRVAELKRKKLVLKDQMTRIHGPSTVH